MKYKPQRNSISSSLHYLLVKNTYIDSDWLSACPIFVEPACSQLDLVVTTAVWCMYLCKCMYVSGFACPGANLAMD